MAWKDLHDMDGLSDYKYGTKILWKNKNKKIENSIDFEST